MDINGKLTTRNYPSISNELRTKITLITVKGRRSVEVLAEFLSVQGRTRDQQSQLWPKAGDIL
jgi:hypothetical protein